MPRSARLIAALFALWAACLVACAVPAAAAPPPSQEKHSMPPTSAHAILALGDSYTSGEAVPLSGHWPLQLVDRLREHGIVVDAPRVVARTGWTTDELDDTMDDIAFSPPYALVTLMIGVNNQYRGRPLPEYRAQFDALLVRAIHLAGDDATRVVVLSIPDWGATPFGAGSGRDLAKVSAEIDAFNAAAREETLARHAAWVDVTPVSREAAHDASLSAHDGLHPSAAMYAKWVDLVLPVVEQRLRK